MPTDIYFISDVVNFVSIGIEALVNPYINQILGFRPSAGHQSFAMYTFYNLFTPFELFIFSWLLFQVIQSFRVKRILLILIIIFAIFFVQYSVQNSLGKSNERAVVPESIIIIIPAWPISGNFYLDRTG